MRVLCGRRGRGFKEHMQTGVALLRGVLLVCMARVGTGCPPYGRRSGPKTDTAMVGVFVSRHDVPNP